MNARELIQDLKSSIEVKNDITESDIKVDIIGNSLEAKAQVSYFVEGELEIIEVVARKVTRQRQHLHLLE